MTTITDLKTAETDVDKVLADINAKQSAAQNGKMGLNPIDVTQDLSLVVTGGIAILKGVEILLWWKPSWKTAIQNTVAFLETFLVPDEPDTTPSETTPTKTAAFYSPNAVAGVGE